MDEKNVSIFIFIVILFSYAHIRDHIIPVKHIESSNLHQSRYSWEL
jgi:hypothetical protein